MSGRVRVASGLERACLGVVLAGVAARAVVTFDPFPGWADDPTAMPTLVSGAGPTMSLAIDAVVMLASGAVLALASLAGRGVGWRLGGLVMIGSVGAVANAWFIRGRTIDDAVLSTAWMAAWCAGLAVLAGARDPRSRALVLACVACLVGMLAAKGAYQVAIEQPRTASSYLANREAMLHAKGWSPDSPLARAYERRLLQREATGWFGLANVYATPAAAGAAGLIVLGVLSRWGARGMAGGRGRAAGASWAPRGEGVETGGTPVPRGGVVGWRGRLIVIGAVVALVALGLSRSKGGVVACACGLGGAAVGAWAASRRGTSPRGAGMIAGTLGLGAILGPLAAVGVRGIVGERLAELSLLFRWFYISTASRVAAGSPAWGVGPDGFQGAYARLKPDISPESVQSPHSVLFDWAATLGVWGLAWGAAVFVLALWVGRAAIEGWKREERDTTGAGVGEAEPHVDGARVDIRVVFLVGAAATLAGAGVEAGLASVELAIVRAGGLCLGVLLALGVVRGARDERAVVAASGAAGLVALAHGQIELTPVNIGAGALWAVLVGLGASGAWNAARRVGGVGGVLVACGAIGVGVLTLVQVARAAWPWERDLREALARVEVLGESAFAMREMQGGGEASAAARLAREVAADLSRELGRTVAPDGPSLARAHEELYRARVPQALELLERAGTRLPGHFPTARAASQLAAQLSQASVGDAGRWASRAQGMIERYVAGQPAKAGAWAWLGTLSAGLAEGPGGDPSRMGVAIEAWSRAAELDPGTIVHALALVRAGERTGDRALVRRWAERALEIDRTMRLDPTQGLTNEQRERFEGLARGP